MHRSAQRESVWAGEESMHNSDHRIAIASNKAKLFLMTLGGFLSAAGGVLLFGFSDADGRYSSIYVKGVSVLSVAFFGWCGLRAPFKLFDGSPGLVLDGEGIIDNASGLAVGRVEWREIHGVHLLSVSGQRFLAFLVDRPEDFLRRGSFLSRVFSRMNYKMYGTPILISANALQVDFDELERQVQDFRRRHDRAQSQHAQRHLPCGMHR
jgi:hypothetical protein